MERPVFLDPEATRQRTVCEAHLQRAAYAASVARSEALRAKTEASQFDVSSLAPKVKRDARNPDEGKVVFSSTAKRAKTASDAPEAQLYSNSALVCLVQRPCFIRSLNPTTLHPIQFVMCMFTIPRVIENRVVLCQVPSSDFVFKIR